MDHSYLTARATFLIAVVIAVATIPTHALAYVGPGAGLTVIGTVVALGGAVLLAIVGFLWYPLKRLMGRNKSASSGQAPEAASEAVQEAPDRAASRK